jgi:hypothetical protein
VHRAIIHLTNDQPISVDLLEMPKAGDIAIVCTNVRTSDGKKPVFIDFASSTFLFPLVGIRFVEVLQAADEAARSAAGAAAATAASAEPEDLEIDEDFLRRVREA